MKPRVTEKLKIVVNILWQSRPNEVVYYDKVSEVNQAYHRSVHGALVGDYIAQACKIRTGDFQ